MKKVLIIMLFFAILTGSMFAKTADGRPTVALVLSGGGAKGIAHIPILEAFETYGIPIDKVYGTSMGSLIGGVYCAGYSPRDLVNLVTNKDLASMFITLETSGYRPLARALDYNRNNIFTLSLDKKMMGTTAIIDDYAIMNFLYNVVGNVPEYLDFNKDLEVPFTCNATNMRDGSKYRWDEGNLIMAMRSSMSIPLAFKPVILPDGTVLMDGGLESNYTVDEAVADGYDIVICVTLPKSETVEENRQKYMSLSGVMGGALDITLKNVSRGQRELATYNIYCDVTGFSTLSFSNPVGILQRGYDAVEKYRDVIEEIASQFTEEQKVYKDPNRRGAYFTKYPQKTHKEIESSIKSKFETAFSKTRFSLGFYGNLGLQFKPDGKSTTDGTDSGRVRKIDMPSISMGYYKPRLFNNEKLGLDLSFKFDLTQNISMNTDIYYQLNRSKNHLFYTYLGFKGQYGVQMVYADQMHSSLTQNGIPEAEVEGHGGFLITNGKNYNIRLEANAQNLFVTGNYLDSESEGYKGYREDYTSLQHFFYPQATLSYVLYNPTSLDVFALDRKRLDVVARGGMYDTELKGLRLTYMFGFKGFKSFKFSDRDAVWLDIAALTSREPRLLRSSYFSYGGFYGMPGYLATDLYRDYIAVGAGYERILKKGIINTVFQIKVMAGIRSKQRYDAIVDLVPMDVNNAPFADCWDNWDGWDIGGSVAFGLGSYIGGDILVGYGLNNHLTHAVYFEIH